ncbi:protein FAM92B [Platysternon megacephalum]|uniref:Protein FAM92B n=1 Tax=Platysternon megacephalum TaxID=55544 RepID=A0A4D9ER83_9SAUR|nr:protein FAM92B [Platysternon megacephalum]
MDSPCYVKKGWQMENKRWITGQSRRHSSFAVPTGDPPGGPTMELRGWQDGEIKDAMKLCGPPPGVEQEKQPVSCLHGQLCGTKSVRAIEEEAPLQRGKPKLNIILMLQEKQEVKLTINSEEKLSSLVPLVKLSEKPKKLLSGSHWCKVRPASTLRIYKKGLGLQSRRISQRKVARQSYNKRQEFHPTGKLLGCYTNIKTFATAEGIGDNCTVCYDAKHCGAEVRQMFLAIQKAVISSWDRIAHGTVRCYAVWSSDGHGPPLNATALLWEPKPRCFLGESGSFWNVPLPKEQQTHESASSTLFQHGWTPCHSYAKSSYQPESAPCVILKLTTMTYMLHWDITESISWWEEEDD